MQRMLAEFVGTFTLVFIAAGSVIASTQTGGARTVTVAIAYGLAVAVMVTATGHVSGGHINPAVTIGAWVTQKIASRDALGYLVAQVAGGVAGAGVLRAALPEALWRGGGVNLGTPTVPATISNGQAILIEAVLTFFLVWVIFGTAIDPEGAFGKVAGLAIGFAVLMGVMMADPFTGGAMNPARALGPALVGGFWDAWWVYWIGPIAGGVLAASLYDSGILRPHLAPPLATEPEAPHGVGAHGEDDIHEAPHEHE